MFTRPVGQKHCSGGNQQIFGAKQQVRAGARRRTEADKASPSAAQFGLERVHGSDEQMFGAE
jgi:hypothetical protein